MHSPEDELPDGVLFPTTEHTNTHEDVPFPASHPVSTCPKISDETDDKLVAQKEKVTKSWNTSRNEVECNLGSNCQAKWKLIVSNPAEEVTNGGVAQGIPYQQTESETIKAGGMNPLLSGSVTRLETGCDAHSPKQINLLEGVELIVDSESMSETGKGQMSNKEGEKQDGHNVQWKGIVHREATKLIGKGSANKMRGIQLLGTKRNITSEKNLNLLLTSIMDQKFGRDTEREELVEKEENDFVYGVNTSETKQVKHTPGSPTVSSLSFQRVDRQESQGQTENAQNMKHQGENSLMKPDAKFVLGVNPDDKLERTSEQRINAVESSTMADNRKHMGGMMDTEPHLYCTVCESPVRDTELRESGRDRDESVRPPVDSNERTSIGKNHLICDKALCSLLASF